MLLTRPVGMKNEREKLLKFIMTEQLYVIVQKCELQEEIKWKGNNIIIISINELG